MTHEMHGQLTEFIEELEESRHLGLHESGRKALSVLRTAAPPALIGNARYTGDRAGQTARQGFPRLDGAQAVIKENGPHLRGLTAAPGA